MPRHSLEPPLLLHLANSFLFPTCSCVWLTSPRAAAINSAVPGAQREQYCSHKLITVARFLLKSLVCTCVFCNFELFFVDDIFSASSRSVVDLWQAASCLAGLMHPGWKAQNTQARRGLILARAQRISRSIAGSPCRPRCWVFTVSGSLNADSSEC